MSRRVVVTGGSCVSSLGMELDEIFTQLKTLKNRIVRLNDWDKYAQMNTRLAGPILYNLPEYPRKKIRCINEGGELGYSIAHAFGAVFDNPDLIATVIVGDGEAETGPLATAWHSNKFINAANDGGQCEFVLWLDRPTHHNEHRMHKWKPFDWLCLRSY